jgi:hypothetical protein
MKTHLLMAAALAAGLTFALAAPAVNAASGGGYSGDMPASDYNKAMNPILYAPAHRHATVSTHPLAVPATPVSGSSAWCNSLRGSGASGDFAASDYGRCAQ